MHGRDAYATEELTGLEFFPAPSRTSHGDQPSVTFTLTMPNSLPQRVPENAPGDFYVEAGCCMQCCIVHGEAPDLLNDLKQPFEHCFFRRQPQTPEEIEQAISAICVSCICALRYGGTDESIISTLHARDAASQCDHTPEGIAWLSRPIPSPLPERVTWWQRLFGKRL